MLIKYSVKQRDIKDCGPACLLSIIKYYGGYVPIEKIRYDVRIELDGVSAYHILKSGQKYGFDTEGIKMTSNEDLLKGKLVLPAIAHVILKNGLSHYVVIYKLGKNNLTLMDPAKGIVKMNYDAFFNIWQKVILEFVPRTKIIKYEKANALKDVLKNIISSNKKIFITSFILGVILTFFSVIASFYLKIGLNIISLNIPQLFILIVCTFFLIYLLKVIISYFKEYLINYLNKNIDVTLLDPFIKHIYNLPLWIRESYTVGELNTRIKDILNIKSLFSNILITFALDTFLVIISSMVLFIINYQLFLGLLLVIVIYLVYNLLSMPYIDKRIQDNIINETNFNALNVAHLNCYTTLKTLNNIDYYISKEEENEASFIKGKFAFERTINKYLFGNSFILEIGLFVINTIGLYLISKNNLFLVDLMTFNMLYFYLVDPIKEMLNLIPETLYIKRTYQKINEFIALNEESSMGGLEFQNGLISFKDVNFSYDNYNYPLKNFNQIIHPKDKVLIMGSSGNGKSTLFKLLYRFYEPSKGNIMINNINIKDYNLNALRNNISYITQDAMLFQDTFLNNLTLGESIPNDILIKVLKICQVDKILDNKALRLNSLLIENSNNLSGGEKARIILARTLLKAKDIILIDEVFASIEVNDANEIINNMMKEYQDKTIVIISHFKPSYKFNQIWEMN